MLSTTQAFDKFRQRLELGDTEQKDAARRQKEVRECIRADFDLTRDFLSGSYSRHTKTKPLKDVDAAIRYALNHPYNSDPLHAKLRPGMKVVIAIDDISLPLPPMRRPDVRERVLTIVLELLADHGVEKLLRYRRSLLGRQHDIGNHDTARQAADVGRADTIGVLHVRRPLRRSPGKFATG